MPTALWDMPFSYSLIIALTEAALSGGRLSDDPRYRISVIHASILIMHAGESQYPKRVLVSITWCQ